LRARLLSDAYRDRRKYVHVGSRSAIHGLKRPAKHQTADEHSIKSSENSFAAMSTGACSIDYRKNFSAFFKQ
jgi:hypothetical protein